MMNRDNHYKIGILTFVCKFSGPIFHLKPFLSMILILILMIVVMILMMLETKVDPLPTSLYFSQPGSNKSIEMRMMLTCCTKNENEANYHHDKRDH